MDLDALAEADIDYTEDGVVVLAKAPGWRFGLQLTGHPNSVLEIAFDQAAAERAWHDNVPAGLATGSGVPNAPGVYGDLAQVDFAKQAVVVWSSGESGSCPEWLARAEGVTNLRAERLDPLALPTRTTSRDFR